MIIVVTGIGGFVGGFAAAALAERHTVFGCYRRSPPNRQAAHAGVQLIQCDLRSAAALPDRYDWLVHCAAEIPATCPSPDELYRINVEASRSVFDHARGAGAQGIVYLSSMAVYGDIVDPVVTERTPIREPAIYGRSKLEGERMLGALAAATGLATTSIRLPGVVGPGSRNNFLSDLGSRILSGQPVRATNPESPFNNVVYIRDLCRFIEALIGTLPPGHMALTVGATGALSIRTIVSSLFRLCGRPERVEFVTAARASFTIAFDAARALGYRPETVEAILEMFAADLTTRT